MRNEMLFLLATLLLLAGGCSNPPIRPVGASLKYDGVYRSTEKPLHYWNYLRFYPDGEVMEVSSTGTPDDLRNWFNEENLELRRGKFTIDGKSLTFSTVSSQGDVDYTGEVDGDHIHLNIYSHINHYQESDVYVFVRWQTEQNP